MWTEDEMKRAEEEDRILQRVLDEASNRPPRPMSTPESIAAGHAAMAEGRERAAATLAHRIESKELLSAAELQDFLGIAQAEIDDAVESGRLFAFIAPDGVKYYPAFFAVCAADRAGLEAVVREMKGLPPDSQYWFLTSRRTNLGVTPLEALKDGRFDDVLRAASGFAIT